jgi:hypothetical protein
MSRNPSAAVVTWLRSLRGPVVSFVVEAMLVVMLSVAAIGFALLALWWV